MDAQYFHQQHACQVQLWIDFYCGHTSYYYRLLLDQCVRGFLLFLITAAVDSKTAVSILSSLHGRMYSWKHVGFCDLEFPILWHPCSLAASVLRLVVLSWRSFFITMLMITNWIHGCDELKEEEGNFKKKDEGGMTTV